MDIVTSDILFAVICKLQILIGSRYFPYYRLEVTAYKVPQTETYHTVFDVTQISNYFCNFMDYKQEITSS